MQLLIQHSLHCFFFGTQIYQLAWYISFLGLEIKPVLTCWTVLLLVEDLWVFLFFTTVSTKWLAGSSQRMSNRRNCWNLMQKFHWTWVPDFVSLKAENASCSLITVKPPYLVDLKWPCWALTTHRGRHDFQIFQFWYSPHILTVGKLPYPRSVKLLLTYPLYETYCLFHPWHCMTCWSSDLLHLLQRTADHLDLMRYPCLFETSQELLPVGLDSPLIYSVIISLNHWTTHISWQIQVHGEENMTATLTPFNTLSDWAVLTRMPNTVYNSVSFHYLSLSH